MLEKKLKNKQLIKISDKMANKLEVLNPFDDKVIGFVPKMDKAAVKLKIKEAKAAYAPWREQTAKQRSLILKKWHDLILDNMDDLATIMTMEQGKPLAESIGEIKYGAAFVEWFAEESKRVYGDVIPSHIKNSKILVTKEPVGVCAAITPWNFPSAMITRKAAAALAAGCVMVVKPSSLTPFSAIALVNLAKQAGLPDGVLSFVTGNASEIGQELATNEDISKISFTGSTQVGKQLMADCAPTLKKLSLELGGNAPFIVFEDADLDRAVDGLMASKFRNSGQTCVSANRIFVQDKIFDKFIKKLAKQVAGLKIGDGLKKGVTQGPLINPKAVQKLVLFIEDAREKGAKIVQGGNYPGGNFFEPTIVTDINQKMQIFDEEIFGPILAISRFKSEKDVIKAANNTKYGLASYFYSNNLAQVWRLADALEYGMVAVNEGMLSTEIAPFGGIKESGFGREGSKYGIDEYVNIKYVLMGGL